MNLSDIQTMVGNTAAKKGWDEREVPFPETIALVHSELSEALEEWRKGWDEDELYFREDGKPEGLLMEMADAVIRIMHWAEVHDLDLEDAILRKDAFNLTRPFRHGGKVG